MKRRWKYIIFKRCSVKGGGIMSKQGAPDRGELWRRLPLAYFKGRSKLAKSFIQEQIYIRRCGPAAAAHI